VAPVPGPRNPAAALSTAVGAISDPVTVCVSTTALARRCAKVTTPGAVACAEASVSHKTPAVSFVRSWAAAGGAEGTRVTTSTPRAVVPVHALVSRRGATTASIGVAIAEVDAPTVAPLAVPAAVTASVSVGDVTAPWVRVVVAIAEVDAPPVAPLAVAAAVTASVCVGDVTATSTAAAVVATLPTVPFYPFVWAPVVSAFLLLIGISLAEEATSVFVLYTIVRELPGEVVVIAAGFYSGDRCKSEEESLDEMHLEFS